jgi:hypothetical protein
MLTWQNLGSSASSSCSNNACCRTCQLLAGMHKCLSLLDQRPYPPAVLASPGVGHVMCPVGCTILCGYHLSVCSTHICWRCLMRFYCRSRRAAGLAQAVLKAAGKPALQQGPSMPASDQGSRAATAQVMMLLLSRLVLPNMA